MIFGDNLNLRKRIEIIVFSEVIETISQVIGQISTKNANRLLFHYLIPVNIIGLNHIW